MTPEAAILGRVLRGDRSWESSADWDVAALTRAADDHGVSALVWQALAGSSGRIAEIREALAPTVRAAATRDIFIQRDIQTVLDSVAAASVRALVIKGSALAYTVYPSPWLRPRTDTDLFVRTEDVAETSRALERCGYSRSDALTSGTLVSHQIAFQRVDAHDVHHVVDLHWKVVNPQVLADSLPFDELWQHARPAPSLGAAARVPAAVDSVALGCVHRLAHHQGHDRLVWLFDLRLLTDRFTDADWDALVQSACRRGIAGLCLDSLREARDRLGTTLPSRVEAAMATAAPQEPSRIFLQGPVHKRDVLVSDLAVLRDWKSRVLLLREHAFPPAAFIRQRYGVRHPVLLPALYLHRLVVGAYRWVRS